MKKHKPKPRFRQWMMQNIPPLDAAVVFFAMLLIWGSMGAWEHEVISFRQMCVQIIVFAGIGYLAGIFGWREVLDYGIKLVRRLSRSLQKLSSKAVRKGSRVPEVAKERKAS
ncbi:MAG: hypothetical protein E7476_07760 [Ruminococcaceae bacterium]|nr:hypothetical protein [Oscillospiraceae bacterium]